jgi:oxygen-independent coproporphyrinogen-3 oxidase
MIKSTRVDVSENDGLDICDWLDKVCRDGIAGIPGVTGSQIQRTEVGASVKIDLGAESIILLARTIDEKPAWLFTSSASFNIECQSDPPSDNALRFLRALRGVLSHADPGNLSFPTPTRQPAPSRGAAPRSADLAERVHHAAFIAYKILTASLPTVHRDDGKSITPWRAMFLAELYPYANVLGQPTAAEEIHDGWRRTSAQIRAGVGPAELGLYIHIPFCAVKCRFCFCAITEDIGGGAMPDYVERLKAELRTNGELVAGLPISSVYVGGGTPSVLSPEQLEDLFRALHTSYLVRESAQITIETNPDSLTERKIEVMRTSGRMNRLTLGIQTLDPEAQRRARRFNQPKRIERLVRACRAMGVQHVNIDLMVGMDGQSIESFQTDVRFVLGLEPDSLDFSDFRPVHATLPEVDEDQIQRRLQMLEWGRSVLREQGFEARRGLPPAKSDEAVNEQLFQSHHRSASLMGLGVSAYAHAYGSYSYCTARDMAPAVLRDPKGPQTYFALASNNEEEKHRYLVYHVQSGFSLKDFRNQFGTDPQELCPEAWSDLEELDRISIEQDQVTVHVRGYDDVALFRVFFYSPRVIERARQLWAHEYDRSADYEGWLRRICRACV